MAEKIYIRNASGEMEPLAEERFQTEELLQAMIGQHPELLAGDQMRPGDPLRWILIRREMPIEGWAVDHLLLDQDARPTLVEVKRGDSPDNRRKVVGQMLDYAATASSVWSERDMRQVFDQYCVAHDLDHAEEIGRLRQDNEPDVNEFWQQVATNLAANRMRLLFVADEIPAELERVVKFLNEQTRGNLEVLAVEVKQYPGTFGDALVSRVIGQTEADKGRQLVARGQNPTLQRCTPAGRKALWSLIVAAIHSGAHIHRGKKGITISKYSALAGRWPYVARFGWASEDDDMPLELIARRDEAYPLPSELREVLQRWLDKFNGDNFVVEHTKSPKWDQGWVMTEDNFIKHADLITERLLETLNEIDGL